jgi:hypothetical protein
MKLKSSQSFLTIYSGVLTLIFAITAFSGFAANTKRSTFDEIDVYRINVVEPDGTVADGSFGQNAISGLNRERQGISTRTT